MQETNNPLQREQEPGTQGPRRVSRKEIEDAFAEGWTVESIVPSRFEVRADLKDFTFSEGGPSLCGSPKMERRSSSTIRAASSRPRRRLASSSKVAGEPLRRRPT